MAGHTKLVFPPPPPTTNELTAEQRHQLVRKTRKLEQILGTTPHFLDTGSEHLPLIHNPSTPPEQPRRLIKARRLSLDSNSSVSSCSSTSSPIRRSLSVRSNASAASSSSGCTYSSATSLDSTSSDEFRISNTRVPFLWLRVDPSIEENPTHDQSPSYNVSNDESISSVSAPSPHSSIPLPDFQISSLTSLRKRKMDRVKKKLGHDVPVHLVFPVQSDSDIPEYSPSSPTPPPGIDFNKECPPLPPPVPRVRKTSDRIAGSRDSLLDSASIHRAGRRSSTSSSDVKPSTKRRKSSSLPTVPPTGPKPIKARLSLIPESPDEHSTKSTGDTAGSRLLAKTTEPQTQWLITFEATSLQASREDSSSAESSPVSPTFTNDNSTKPSKKKRPSSYRKPVPPVSDD